MKKISASKMNHEVNVSRVKGHVLNYLERATGIYLSNSMRFYS